MTENVIPNEFKKIIKDFVRDIKTTFPEYIPLINKWWKNESEYSYIQDENERNAAIEKGEAISVQIVFEFCKKKMTSRFFDILYQNDEIFAENSDIDTEFLPHIHFKNLWHFNISDKTRETIWKYLQLIIFSIVGTIDNKEGFGDTAKIFEAINQEEFKSKLEETLSKMQNLFDSSANFTEEFKGLGGNLNMEDMPNAKDLHEHITGMLDGKLGKLAREIAEETAQSINMDTENVTDMKDVLSNLIKNPNKLMGMVKNVSEKLDSKMKSGEIKESELISEATTLMNKMKNMNGMCDIQSMLRQMGLSGMGGLGGLGNLNGKVNTSAMEAQLERNLKMAKTKERMRAKVEATRLAKEQQQQQMQSTMSEQSTQQQALAEEQVLKLFSNEENSDTKQKSNKKNKKKTK